MAPIKDKALQAWKARSYCLRDSSPSNKACPGLSGHLIAWSAACYLGDTERSLNKACRSAIWDEWTRLARFEFSAATGIPGLGDGIFRVGRLRRGGLLRPGLGGSRRGGWRSEVGRGHPLGHDHPPGVGHELAHLGRPEAPHPGVDPLVALIAGAMQEEPVRLGGDQRWALVPGKADAHDRLVGGDGHVHDPAAPDLDPGADQVFLRAGQGEGHGAYLGQGHHDLILPPAGVPKGITVSGPRLAEFGYGRSQPGATPRLGLRSRENGVAMPKAVRFDDYGGIDVLRVEDVPRPVPGDGQVLVQVKAAGINPGEDKIRQGLLRERWPATFPSGQGSDLAGIVAQTGPGVAGFSAGDEVLGWTDNRSTQAEFVLAEAGKLTAKPAGVLWEVAGALFVAGTTAYAAVRAVALSPGDTVVVAGASGGVGTIAVQLARRAGATV